MRYIYIRIVRPESLLERSCLIAVFILLASFSVTAQRVVWRSGIAYSCNAQANTASIRASNQLRDSLQANPYIRIPARIWHEHQEYTVSSIDPYAFNIAGKNNIKSIYLPFTLNLQNQCLANLGKIDTVVLSYAFTPSNFGETKIVSGTYPKCLVFPSLRSDLHVQIAGSIYSRDRRTLYYYTRQEGEDMYYMPYRTSLANPEAFRSADLEHLVLNGKLHESVQLNDLTHKYIDLLNPQAKVYDPYNLISSEKICRKVFENHMKVKFMLPMNHPLRKDKNARSLNFAKASELPSESSFTLHTKGEGTVFAKYGAYAFLELEDGETRNVPFSSVVTLKLEPAKGYRAIGIVFRGDTIPTQFNGEVWLGLCQMGELITAFFAPNDALVNGVDYRLSPGGVLEHWTYSDAFTDQRALTELVGVKAYGKHFLGTHTPKVHELIMPLGLSQIGDSAMHTFYGLRSLALPGGLAVLGRHAFKGLDKIDRLYIGGPCAVNHDLLMQNLSFGGSRIKPLRVFVDAEHIASWKFLEKLRHIRLIPSSERSTISLIDSPVGEIRVEYDGQVATLRADNPSIVLPRFTRCRVSCGVPIDYQIVSIDSQGTLELPTECYLLGDMPIALKVREAYCRIEEPIVAGARVIFERLDGTQIMPLDSVRRGQSVRIKIVPDKHNLQDKVTINGTPIYKTDSVVLMLRDLSVTAKYMPQYTFFTTSQSSYYHWLITPPLPPSAQVKLGETYQIDIAVKEGYKLKEFTVNGDVKTVPIRLEVGSRIDLKAKVDKQTYRILYDSTTTNRFRIEDIVGNPIPSGTSVEYGTNLRLLYGVNLPEHLPKLYLNGELILSPPSIPFLHTVTSDCRFTMSYDTLWRVVSLSTRARGVLHMSAKRGVETNGKLLLPQGDSVSIEVLSQHAHRVISITIGDEHYYGKLVRIPVFADKRVDVELQNPFKPIRFAVQPQHAGTIELKESTGRAIRNGGKVPIGTRIAINAFPSKGFALSRLYVNQQLVDNVPFECIVTDSTAIDAHFERVPCVMYGDFCIDTARRELVYADTRETLVVIDNPLVENIGISAFADNNHMEYLTVGESVRRVESGAFMRCENFRMATIAQSVSYIGEEAFAHCPSLVGVELKHSSPSELRMADNAFEGSKHTHLFVRVANHAVSRFAKSRRYDYFSVVGEESEVRIADQDGNEVPIRIEITSLEEQATVERIMHTPIDLPVKGGNLVRITALNGVTPISHNGYTSQTPYLFQAKGIESIQLAKSSVKSKAKNGKITSVEATPGLIYPNPTSSLLHVVVPSDGNYTIYSSMGIAVRQGSISSGTNVLATYDLPIGIYILHILYSKSSEAMTFVKQ